MIDRTAVIAALDAVSDPKSGQGLVAAGLVQGLMVGEDRAGFVMEVPAGETAIYAPVRDAAEAIDVPVINKPLKPAILRTIMMRVRRMAPAAE